MPGKTTKAKPKPKKKTKTPTGKPFTKDDPRINRNGRPRKGQALTEILSDVLDETNKSGKTRREAIAEKIITLAERGDIVALKYIFDRIDGKPTATMEIKNSEVDARLIKILEGE